MTRIVLGFERRIDFGEYLGGIAQGTIGNAERGDNLPAPALLAALVDRFGVNLNWLFTGQGNMWINPDLPMVARISGAHGVVPHGTQPTPEIKAAAHAEAEARRAQADAIRPIATSAEGAVTEIEFEGRRYRVQLITPRNPRRAAGKKGV